MSLMKYVRRAWRFCSYVVSSFVSNDGLYRASALTFTTLLAVVPLMSVGVTILAAFPVFKSAATPMQNFIFENFVPATGKVVQSYLESFAAQASQLSLIGVIFLVITAILMMFTIEQAMNQIWRVRVPRKGVSAFLLYWAGLSLAPILMGVSFAVSSYLFSAPLISGTAAALGMSRSGLLAWAPYCLSLITFTLLYVVIPHCRVRFKHGFTGAIVAATLLECAKAGFAYYLQRFDTYELLYGAFAAVPIFFLWIYWVWLIILIGAEIAHAVSVNYARRIGVSLDPFTHTIRWLRYLWHAQQQGQALSLDDLIRRDQEKYQVAPDELLQHMISTDLIKPVEGGSVMLARDLSQFSVLDLYRLLPWRLPLSRDILATKHEDDRKLARVVANVEKTSQEQLSMSVATLLGDNE